MTAVTEDAFRKDEIAIDVLQELQEELAKVKFKIREKRHGMDEIWFLYN